MRFPRPVFRHGRLRRRERIIAVAVCGGLLVAARSVRLLDGPQVVALALAAAAFGAIAAFVLRYFRPRTSVAMATAVGTVVALLLFAGALTAGQ